MASVFVQHYERKTESYFPVLYLVFFAPIVLNIYIVSKNLGLFRLAIAKVDDNVL